MPDMDPDELRKASAQIRERHDPLASEEPECIDPDELDDAADEWEAQEWSWLALLREVSKLDEETTDWIGASDDTFLEQFDPWAVLRKAVSLRKRLEAAEKWIGDAKFFLESQVKRGTEDRLDAAELLAGLAGEE